MLVRGHGRPARVDAGSAAKSNSKRAGRPFPAHPLLITPPAGADEGSIAQEIDLYYFLLMNTISLKLPDRLLERLEAAACARGTTKSSLVRECLEQSLDARPVGTKASCYDLASDLAGSLKGLPRDLATNPKHLEGFGQ